MINIVIFLNNKINVEDLSLSCLCFGVNSSIQFTFWLNCVTPVTFFMRRGELGTPVDKGIFILHLTSNLHFLGMISQYTKNKFETISFVFGHSGSYPGCQRLFQRGFRFLSSLYSDPREKPLEQSAIALMAPIQSLARLNQLVQILDKTADWLLTTT